MRRRACRRVLLRLYRSGAFCLLLAVFVVTLGPLGRRSWLRHRGPGRRSASVSVAATPRQQAVVAFRLLCADGNTACGCFVRIIEGRRNRVTVLEVSARMARRRALWCSLRTVRSAAARSGSWAGASCRPRSVLSRRTGRFLTGLDGLPARVCSFAVAPKPGGQLLPVGFL